MDDLFGHVPQAGELAIEESSAPTSSGPIQHTPETVRAIMLEILETARNAETMPFTPRELQSHTGMYPYMAEWLEEGGEGERLLAEFRAEIDRLKAKSQAAA
jgi:hypothetical protein